MFRYRACRAKAEAEHAARTCAILWASCYSRTKLLLVTPFSKAIPWNKTVLLGSQVKYAKVS